MAVKTKTTKTKDIKDIKGLKEVQEHYLDYPYPMRNPDDDKTRLLKVYGDSTVFLAEQLKDTDAEVIYLDFSKNRTHIVGIEGKHADPLSTTLTQLS